MQQTTHNWPEATGFSALGKHPSAGVGLSSDFPEVYGLLKRYATEEGEAGWLLPSTATQSWLTALSEQRETLGSARAGAWLHALGEDALEEVIILPVDERRMEVGQRMRARTSQEALILDAYPNPSSGLVRVACNVPEGVEHAMITVRDVHGKLLKQVRIGTGAAVVDIDLSSMASGIYIAEMELDDVRAGQVKVAVQ